MAEHTVEKFTINGCSIELLRGGTGETLLFLHGAGGIKEWSPYLDALAEKYDVLAPSHPGFGASDNPDWLDSMSDLAFFYLDLLEELDLRDVHLVGNSLGGWIASEVASPRRQSRSRQPSRTISTWNPRCRGIMTRFLPWRPRGRQNSAARRAK